MLSGFKIADREVTIVASLDFDFKLGALKLGIVHLVITGRDPGTQKGEAFNMPSKSLRTSARVIPGSVLIWFQT